jgi:hypothetical protein
MFLTAMFVYIQAPHAGFYTVTVTGVVGGMLPPKPGDILMNTSPVYAQIFLTHNGKKVHSRIIVFNRRHHKIFSSPDVITADPDPARPFWSHPDVPENILQDRNFFKITNLLIFMYIYCIKQNCKKGIK